jgi:hypothetical protein
MQQINMKIIKSSKLRNCVKGANDLEIGSKSFTSTIAFFLFLCKIRPVSSTSFSPFEEQI